MRREACVLEPSLGHAARVDNVHAVFGEPPGFALSRPKNVYIFASVPQPGHLHVLKKHLLQVMPDGKLPALPTLFFKVQHPLDRRHGKNFLGAGRPPPHGLPGL